MLEDKCGLQFFTKYIFHIIRPTCTFIESSSSQFFTVKHLGLFENLTRSVVVKRVRFKQRTEVIFWLDSCLAVLAAVLNYINFLNFDKSVTTLWIWIILVKEKCSKLTRQAKFTHIGPCVIVQKSCGLPWCQFGEWSWDTQATKYETKEEVHK